MNELDLYGPPGTGKTTQLTRLALSAVRTLGGPERLGAVTYTRAAALELKGRIAAALGIPVPADPRAARKLLEQAIPWVGTIHSLCYRLIGRPPTLTGKDLNDFAHSQDPRNERILRFPNNPDDVEGYEWQDEAARTEIELTLQVHAMARHRECSIEEAMRSVSLQGAMTFAGPTPEKIKFLARKYEQFKADIGKIDFEDMLTLGRKADLPVQVLLCDEVQDNSRLLWSAIDAWSKATALTVMAGDPWQAIYLFSGASPDLFRRRMGKWQTIGNSHRLSESSAVYALDLLRLSGYAEDSLLSTWTGLGGLPKENGSQFFLARTNRLLSPIRDTLEWSGTPYRLLRGIGPLQMKAAQVFRAWVKEDDGLSLTARTAALIADLAPTGAFAYGMKARLTRLAEEDPEMEMTDEILAHAYFTEAVRKIPNWRYYETVLKLHGMQAFIVPANTAVGTIHAAKGREADEVSVVRSWGYLPGRAIHDGHHLEEACVAYVAATRHRSKLTILDGFEGIPYPFPAQRGQYVD